MNKCLNCRREVKNKYCNVSCQNSHQNKSKNDKKFGTFKDFVVKCKLCVKEFVVTERENLHPKKENYFCSLKCSNKRIDDKSETKKIICISCNEEREVNKRSGQKVCRECLDNIESLKPKRKFRELISFRCKMCEKEFKDKKKNRIFCSKSCQSTHWNKNNHDLCVKAGLKSVHLQSQTRRSKNEISFANLCIDKFSNVLVNAPIFNGWDADVIIQDMKIAILWNGKWHYDQISKSQSLLQVQNRDKIKIKEIKRCGYTPYTIKDMGKADIRKVKDEWNIFLEWFGIKYQLNEPGDNQQH